MASGYQKKRFGWLLAGFWLLAETGWTSPLPGGGLVQALPLPQTKQSRWHAWACEGAQASRLGRPEKGCTSLTPCKAALPNQASACLVWLASGYQKKRFGWLLAIKKRGLVGFWLASGWLVLTWLKLAGPPRCLGAALCKHCPSHKRSKVDGTCGLAKQPRRRSRLGRNEKGCTSLTPCKAQAALPNQASLAETGWTSPAAWGRPCAGTAPPTNEAK